MVFKTGYRDKVLSLVIFLVLLNKASTTASTTESDGFPGSFYHGGRPIEGVTRKDSVPDFETIENETTARRVLLQRGRQSQSPVQSDCELSSEEVERFYNEPSRQWTVNDDVLDALDNDLQAIMECANEDDVVLFRTIQQIKPKRTLILSKNLTIASQPEPEFAESEGSVSESDMVRMTCPDSGQLIISRSPSLTLGNLVIEDCKTTSSVIEIDPDCDDVESMESVRFYGMIIQGNAMLGQGHIIDASRASCLHLELDNVSMRRNRCAGPCIVFSSNSTLYNLTLERNKGSSTSSIDSSIFSASVEGSKIDVRNVTAKKNEIRSFQIFGGILSIAIGRFSDNRRNVSSVTRENSTGGGVLLIHRSSVSIFSAIFERNYALNGGVLYASSSTVNISECMFDGNDAGDGDGGAIYGHYNCSFDISSSTFSKNRGYFGAALRSNFTARVNMVNSRILENSCSRSSAISISEGHTTIKSCDFLDNNAQQAGAALGILVGTVFLTNSSFIGNEAGSCGACIFERNCTVSGSSLLFEKNRARVYDGGGIVFAFGGRMTIRDSRFHHNYALSDGGAIYTQGECETVLKRVVFLNNTTGDFAGALQIWRGNFTGSHLTFRENQASNYGGAISFYQANTITVSESRFEGNNAKEGGAVHFHFTRSGHIDGCTFERNAGQIGSGGALRAELSNVTILSSLFRANTSPSGGSIGFFKQDSATILNSRFENNTAAENSGGAIDMRLTSSLILSNSSFSGNSGFVGAAFAARASTNIAITRAEFVENIASVGGCLFLIEHSRGTILNSVLSNNIAENGGGAIYMNDGSELTISDSKLEGNNRGSFGGGIQVSNSSVVEITDVFFEKNEARNGGAMHMLESSNATIVNCNFTKNIASTNGGALAVQDKCSVSLATSTFSDNKARFGGALSIQNNSTSILSFNTFAGNDASTSGGGIHLYASNMLLMSSRLESNNATFGGSLFAFDSSMEVTNSTIRRSHARREGGAILMYASNATLETVFLESNNALDNGGGIYVFNASRIIASNVDVVSNMAGFEGGGIALVDASSLLCYSCLLVKNRAVIGAGLHVYSNNSIPIVAQLQNSRFVNNSAGYVGGGIGFAAFQNRSIDCINSPSAKCGNIFLLNTSFVGNYANYSGAIVLSMDSSEVLVDCDYRGRRNKGFLNDRDVASLKALDPKQLCSSWTKNRLASDAYGDVVGTYGQEIVLTIDPKDEVKLTGSSRSGYVLGNVRSGRQLPTINVTIVDGYGAGPAPTIPYVFGAQLSSPDDLFNGMHRRSITFGFSNFSRVIGLVPPGNYTLEFAFDNDAFGAFNVTVMVRECMIGEESTRDGLTCQECDAVSFNFNASEVGGCKECPIGATCEARYIVPKKGYWHKSPCHDTVQSCLVDEACSYNDRHEALTNFTQDSTDCKINVTTLDSYNDALCNEGYKGPLCGSCEKSYGRSFRFQCFSCPRRFASLLTLLGLTLYLLASSAITVRGTLPSSSTKTGSTRGQLNNRPSTSSQHPATEVDIEESLPQDSIEEGGAKSKSFVIRSPSLKPMNGHELLKWKTTEILKILINFLQTIAVAATVNVQWTAGVLEVFETSEYMGVLTTSASSGPIDCLISSDSPKTRSIARILLTLLVPITVIITFFSFWSVLTYKKKQSMAYFWKRSLLSIIAVIYISYLGLTQVAVRVFYCVDVNDSADPFINVKSRYWAVDTAVTCYGEAHGRLIAIGVILLLFVPFGFPLISAIVLFQTKAHDRQSIGWQLETMGFLYRAFKEEFVYWESLIMLRKALLSVIVVFSYPLGGQIQGLLAALVIVFGLYFHQACAPFRQEFSTLNHYESVSLLVSCVTFILGQFFTAEKSSSTTRVLIAIVIIVASTSFFAFLVFVLIKNVIEQLRESLQNTNANISQNTPWWKVVKVFITSRLSAMCRSKR